MILIMGAMSGIFGAHAQQAGKLFYYPVKSAIVEYKCTGTNTGTEILYLDNNGRLSARYSQLTTKAFGSSNKTDQIVIQNESTTYTIDLINKTGVKSTLKMDEKEMKEWTETAETIWKDMGFEKTGEGTVLGKNCDIYEGMSTKIWVWKNLALKTEINMFGKSTIEATRLEVDIPIDNNKFRVPDGIKMTEENIEVNKQVKDSLSNQLKKGLKDFEGLFK
jgi:hypothetical protein